MEYLIQQVINGLTLGSIYGLIAIGYTMVFGIIGMVNFAHGDVFMLSAFIALILFLALSTLFGTISIAFALLIVLLVGMALTSLWAWTIERVAYRPLRGSFRLAPMISAIGMSYFLSNFVQAAQGPNNKPLEIVPTQVLSFNLAPDVVITLSWKQIVIMATTAILLAALWYLVQRTPLGRAQRATEQDRKMASILGIDTDRTISLTFIIGAALASVAGLLWIVNYSQVNFSDGYVPGIKAFAAAVLGGIGSLQGAALGGILIGLVEALWTGYVSSDYKDVAALLILIIVLVFMPSGLFGRPDVEKV